MLGHSADEIRGTGGFVSSVWLVRFESGKLTKVDYFDSARVDDWERLLLYPKAPGGLEEHMNAWVWLMRDVSWDPDFPTTALAAQDMFRLGQRREVDGVIAINQWTLLKLVESLGSIPIRGVGTQSRLGTSSQSWRMARTPTAGPIWASRFRACSTR